MKFPKRVLERTLETLTFGWSQHPNPMHHCISTAHWKACNEDPATRNLSSSERANALREIIGLPVITDDRAMFAQDVYEWNDAPERKKEEVLDVVRRAIAEAVDE